MTPQYAYRATLGRVLDGDTFEMDVDLGFHVRARVRVRLRGLFAAEADTPSGAAATARATAVLQAARTIVLVTQKTRTGEDVQSFQRYVADLWVDGDLLAEKLRVDPPAGVGTRTAWQLAVEVYG